MAGAGISKDQASITLRLDTTQAQRDLDRFMGGVRGATIGVGGVSERIVGTPPAGGGGGGGGGGDAFGRLRNIAGGVAGAIAAPVLGAWKDVTGSAITHWGERWNEDLGLSEDQRRMGALDSAYHRTLAALRGIRVTGPQAIETYQAFRGQETTFASLDREHIQQLQSLRSLDVDKELTRESEAHLKVIKEKITAIESWVTKHTGITPLFSFGR